MAPKKIQPSISKYFSACGGRSKQDTSTKEVETVDLTEDIYSNANINFINHQKRSASKKEANITSEKDHKRNIDYCELNKSATKDMPKLFIENDEADITIEDNRNSHEKSMASRQSKTVKSSKRGSIDIDINNVTKKVKPSTFTPLEKQVLEFKHNNPDKMLAFQVGYKYKLYGKDAEAGSQILNVMHISDKKDEQFSYCTFPDFKLHVNLKRLLNHGFKIGVIKQVESAIVKSIEKTSNSDLMKRELTGVYTKGTYMNDEFTASTSNRISFFEEENQHYIVCVKEEKNSTSIVAVQPLTGDIIFDIFSETLKGEELETRLLYLNPSEIIVLNEEQLISPNILRCIRSISNDMTIINSKTKGEKEIRQEIIDFFSNLDEGKYKELSEYYFTNFSNSIQACINALINYLNEFKLSSVFTIPSNISSFARSNKFMILSGNTLKALEIFQNSTDLNSKRGSLSWLLNHTRTRFGNRLLNKWIARPLVQRKKIEERLQAIEDLTSNFNHFVDSMKNQLGKIGSKFDLEESLIKIHYSSSYNSNKISRREIYSMLDCFNTILNLVKSFDKSIDEFNESASSPLLIEIFNKLYAAAKSNTVTNFLRMINPHYILNESNDLDEQKTQFFDLEYHNWESITKEKIEIERIENLLEEELGTIRSLLKRPQLKFITNKSEPYLVEIRNNQVDSLPQDWQKINGTTSVSRFRTPEVSRLLKFLQYHKQMLVRNSDIAFSEFLKEINGHYEYFQQITKNLAIFDSLLSLAAASSLNGSYVKPTISDEQVINVTKSRNPIIENLSHTKNYVDNNINMSYSKDRVLIITGPNMGGKSSYVKQVALTVIMAQIGCYIPCDSATLGIFDSVFIRMGASDNILKGDSTFMTEMLECSNILKNLSSKSLVILDEIGRGTGTNDGIAIAYSILKYITEHELKPLTLFITHYPSLHVLQNDYDGIISNYHMGYLKVPKPNQEFPDIIFLYTLAEGVANNSYGLNVARLASLPDSIIRNAFYVSENLKNSIENNSCKKVVLNFAKVLKSIKTNDSCEINIEDLFNCI